MDTPFELMRLEDLDVETRGETMQRIASGHRNTLEARRQLIEAQCLRAKHHVKDHTAFGNDNLCGLMPEAAIPQSVIAEWKAKFLTEAEEANVSGVTGHECWRDDGRDGFLTWFRKHHPEYFYEELKITNSIIVPATKWTRIADVRAELGRQAA